MISFIWRPTETWIIQNFFLLSKNFNSFYNYLIPEKISIKLVTVQMSGNKFGNSKNMTMHVTSNKTDYGC
jgi:hypothetical protein